VLRRLVADRASGELVITSEAIEIHVYLLDGRLVWGGSSIGGNEFLRRLAAHHGLSSDAVHEVIEGCRQTPARLGDTLIARAHATADQVRDALRPQITDALLAVIAHPEAHCLFLPRRIDYSRELTFELDELAIELGVAMASASPELAQQRIATVLDRIPDALWVEVIEGGIAIARSVRGLARPSEAVRRLQRLLRDTGIDALAIRSPAHGAVLGQRLPGIDPTRHSPAPRAEPVGSSPHDSLSHIDRALWCAVGAGAKLGVASAVLADAAGAPPDAGPPAHLGDAWQEAIDPGAPLVPSVFADAFKTADDLIAGFALGTRGGPTGMWRGGTSLDEHAAWSRRLLPALEVATHDVFDRPAGALLYDLAALRALAGGVAYYGTLVPNRALGVWIVLRRWTPPNLGWALLHTIARQVGEL
jgi:hypothetical protein